MSDVTTNVTARIESVKSGLARLRDQVPGTDWQQAAVLKLLAELAEIVGQLTACAGPEPASGRMSATKPAENRKDQLGRLAWMACRVLPAGLEGCRRDAEICRILESWHVNREELRQLGYFVAERVVMPKKQRRAACSAV